MTKKQRECCPLFTEALHSGGSFEEGLLFSQTTARKSEPAYCFRIPGKGRGSKRVGTRSLVLLHCPFCGAPPKAGEKRAEPGAEPPEFRRSRDGDKVWKED